MEHVPGLALERCFHGWSRIDSLPLDFVAATPQRAPEQQGVVLGILDDQYANVYAHGCSLSLNADVTVGDRERALDRAGKPGWGNSSVMSIG
jgi:hypothetical protein